MKSEQIRVYEILESKFGRQETEILMEYFEGKSKLKIEEKKDCYSSIDKISMLRNELVETKVELLKWNMIFSIGTAMVIIFSILVLGSVLFHG